MLTYKALNELKRDYKNLTVGIHTVISNFNIELFAELCEYVKDDLKPDSFITEIAEQRVELDTVGLGITPTAERYEVAIDTLLESIRATSSSPAGRGHPAFRRQYYEMVKRTLREHRQVIPCMAGVASAQIAPNGDVWPCCVRAQSMGNLREHDYDFAAVWRTAQAGELRRSIKAGECYCPLANAAYTNMLTHGPTLRKVATEVALSRVARCAGITVRGRRRDQHQLQRPPTARVASRRRGPVTGGTGFLGAALARRLLADGARVRILARSAARARDWPSLARRLSPVTLPTTPRSTPQPPAHGPCTT